MQTSLPPLFCERMKMLLCDGYENFINEIENGSSSKGLFINKSTTSFDQSKFNATPICFCKNGYYFDFDGIGNTPLHHAGGIYIQDPSAMATIAALGERKFKNILDMCASPGGKTLGAAMLLEEDGVIVSNEYVPQRCKTLVGNIERFAVRNSIVTNFDMTKKNELCDIYDSFFDLVICDAPCSGEGMFRKYTAEAVGEWSQENVRLCTKRQKEILDNAASLVSPDGILLYSTCTFSLEENEMQVDEFLDRHPEFELIPASLEVQKATDNGYIFDGCKNKSITLTRRFYPHISQGEGQFIALFKKSVSSKPVYKKDKYKTPLSKPKAEEIRVISDFAKKNLTSFDIEKVYKYNENLVYIDFDAKIPASKIFACGIKLGEINKTAFIPHHQFFKCFGDMFINKADLSNNKENTEKYLHGEVIETDLPNGWCVLMYNNLILGGGKVVDGVVKNHYPKGLRTL